MNFYVCGQSVKKVQILLGIVHGLFRRKKVQLVHQINKTRNNRNGKGR